MTFDDGPHPQHTPRLLDMLKQRGIKATFFVVGQNAAQYPDIIKRIAAGKRPGEAINILTHCNAGWLATVDWGTATAPIYTAHDAGLPIHVWVDETRPQFGCR
jgi:peptidoglycan/xylan/chitin deacetylase (PgdA/CDA1 family)